LSSALQVLTHRLVKFYFFGSISEHLFAAGDPDAWPRLQDFLIEFEDVGTLGRVILEPGKESIFDRECCFNCGHGEVQSAYGVLNNRALRVIAAAEEHHGADAQFEEGFDLLM